MNYLKTIQDVLALEAKVITDATERITQDQADQVIELYKYLTEQRAQLVFTGVGKSGLIAQKLAATFCSLGLPSFFLHPTEALHGDLGRLRSQDALVLISKSGNTEEVVKLLPFVSTPKERMIALVGNKNSELAKASGIVFDLQVEREACVNNQAPTTSSTLAMAMGDALAVMYESWVGLSREGFAQNHPGGLLGKVLRLKVHDLMWKKSDCPCLPSNSTLQDVIIAMTSKPVGGCAIIDGNEFKGIIVEGDIRRTFTKDNQGLDTSVMDILNAGPVSVQSDALAYEALELMEKRENQIYLLPVLEANGEFLGFIRLHDLWKEGFRV